MENINFWKSTPMNEASRVADSLYTFKTRVEKYNPAEILKLLIKKNLDWMR